jgi:acetylornithine deacetylase/succinyl-diaminopimelate desuccinylase-like protein
LLLSHGAGHLNVNVTTTPKESTLDKVLKVATSTSKVLAPLFGFPAISTLALGAFYDFFGKMEAASRDNFLLTTTHQDVVVAKQGLKVAEMDIHPLYLLSGDYLFVPAIHQAEFESKMSNLTLVNGFAVETASDGVLADRVKNAIPDVSYLALSVRVLSASEVPNTIGITDSVLSDQPRDGSKPSTQSGGNKQSKPNH